MNDGLCNDSLSCNGTETCSAQNGCEAGPAPCADDFDLCTEDLCTEAAGCVYEPIDECRVAVPTSSENGRALLLLLLLIGGAWFGFFRKTGRIA